MTENQPSATTTRSRDAVPLPHNPRSPHHAPALRPLPPLRPHPRQPHRHGPHDTRPLAQPCAGRDGGHLLPPARQRRPDRDRGRAGVTRSAWRAVCAGHLHARAGGWLAQGDGGRACRGRRDLRAALARGPRLACLAAGRRAGAGQFHQPGVRQDHGVRAGCRRQARLHPRHTAARHDHGRGAADRAGLCPGRSQRHRGRL